MVRKDSYLPTHQDIDCPNLKVMMTVKSLVSKGYLAQVFNWQWNYYTVTSKGVTFLAKALGVSSAVVPATFKQKKAVITAPPKGADGEDEKPAAVDGAAEETPAGMGRGSR